MQVQVFVILFALILIFSKYYTKILFREGGGARHKLVMFFIIQIKLESAYDYLSIFLIQFD